MREMQDLREHQAKQKLSLFLKLRKGKVISDKYIKDFHALISSLYRNFKSSDEFTFGPVSILEIEAQSAAIEALKSDFIKFESGAYVKKSDITKFSFYKDQKFRATINGEYVEISSKDFEVLKYVFT